MSAPDLPRGRVRVPGPAPRPARGGDPSRREDVDDGALRGVPPRGHTGGGGRAAGARRRFRRSRCRRDRDHRGRREAPRRGRPRRSRSTRARGSGRSKSGATRTSRSSRAPSWSLPSVSRPSRSTTTPSSSAPVSGWSSACRCRASSRSRRELGTNTSHFRRYVVSHDDGHHTMGQGNGRRGALVTSASRRQAVHDARRAARDERRASGSCGSRTRPAAPRGAGR